VVLNRVGSVRHEAVLRAACGEVGLPVLGALPRHAELAVPSRHLGLVTAAEHGAAATAAVAAMADLVAAHVDLDAVVRLAEPLVPGPMWDPVAELIACAPSRDAPPDRANAAFTRTDRANAALARSPRPVVAVAGGAAFTFGYAEHAELMVAAGLDVAVVDPLRDEALPDRTAALVLPGGFPEEHVAALSANTALRAAVAAFAASGAPVHAECGGLLYLGTSLDGVPLCDVLPAQAEMTDRLTLGYREAVALTGSVPFVTGQRVAGHEFHRCAVTPRAGASPAWGWRGGEPEGFVVGGVHASFLHTHPAGAPGAVARLARRVAAAAAPASR
jgi:cobyrinic acid a,c-diamide synthase